MKLFSKDVVMLRLVLNGIYSMYQKGIFLTQSCRRRSRPWALVSAVGSVRDKKAVGQVVARCHRGTERRQRANELRELGRKYSKRGQL